MLNTIFNILSIISAIGGGVWLTWYAFFAKKENGGKWTSSYSNTWKLWNKVLQEKEYNWGLYVVLSCAFFILPAYHFSNGWVESALAIIAMIGLFAMGCWPSSVNKLQTKFHVWAVQVCVVGAIVWCLLHCWWLVLACLGVCAIPYVIGLKKGIPNTLWVEWFGFVSVYLFLLVWTVMSM